MAPDLEGFLSGFDKSRRDFLRKIVAGAAFVPPVMASFSLDGPSIAEVEAGIVANQCFPNQTLTPLFFDFSGNDYTDNFRDILRGGDINAGFDLATLTRPSLNFTGSAGSAGSTWLTVLNGETFVDLCQICVSAEVLSHPFNNNKGAGVVALFNEGTGQKGLALLLMNAGNTDVLQLVTVDPAGKLSLLKSVALGSGIHEDVWYHLTLEVTGLATPTVTVTGKVFQHSVPSNPNSPLGAQVGTTLSLAGLLPTGVSHFGEVGLVGRAVSASIATSLTNFTVTPVEGTIPP